MNYDHIKYGGFRFSQADWDSLDPNIRKKYNEPEWCPSCRNQKHDGECKKKLKLKPTRPAPKE